MVADRRLGRIPATLPARYASMVSEPLADKLVEADDNSGGGFRHRRSNLGTRGPIECDFKLQSDSRRSTVYDDNLGEAIDLRFEEKMDHHHRELMDLLESLCRGNHTPTRSEWTIADEGAPPSSLSRTPAVRQNFQVSISNPTLANSRILRKGGGNNTVISTVSVCSYSPKEEENLLGNYDDLSDDYESDEDDFMEESDFEELAETLGGDTGVDKGDEVVFEGGVQRIANEEKQQIELSVIWNDDEEEYDFCNDDVEEVRIEKDVRRKAEEKKEKPKSVVLDEPCAVLDDVDDEDAVAIAQSPQGEPALGALDCVWGKSRCFSETPNLNPVLQQKSIVSIAMAIPRPKKTSRAQQPAESILRRLVSSTSKTNPILNLGQESNDSLNQRPIDYDIGWKLDPGSGAVKALQVTLLGEVFDSGGTIDNAAAVKFETSESGTPKGLLFLLSMASRELEKELSELHVTTDPHCNGKSNSLESQAVDGDVQITFFTENLHDTTIHFQIIKLAKQIYTWIGCNSANFGHLYAAAPTRPNNMVSVTSLMGGTADNAGSSIARHLVLKTGLSLILACNIPKDSPMLEAAVEKKLLEKFRSLGYIKPKPQAASSSVAGPR